MGIGGIKPHLTKAHLTKHFKKFGDIVSIFLKADPQTKLNKGFAFLVYKDASSVEKVLSQPQIIAGREVECRLSMQLSNNSFVKKEVAKSRLFVRCLSPDQTSADLVDYFEQFGQVKHAYIIMEPMSQISKCFGYVHFEDKKSAKFALKALKKQPHTSWQVTHFMQDRKKEEQTPDETPKKSQNAKAQIDKKKIPASLFQKNSQKIPTTFFKKKKKKKKK